MGAQRRCAGTRNCLQHIVAKFNHDLHPILRFMYVSGMAEGWALYTEKLADETGLYSSEPDRLGMLSNEAYRAARLDIDRYIAVPGQATSYFLGSLEIQRLRRKAEQTLADEFDIKVFHDKVIENGSVSLPMLQSAIDQWIGEQN